MRRIFVNIFPRRFYLQIQGLLSPSLNINVIVYQFNEASLLQQNELREGWTLEKAGG